MIAPGGKAVLTDVAEDRQQYVAEVSLAGGKGGVRRLTTESGTAEGMSEGGGHVAVLWTTDSAPAEVYALDEGKLRKLTTHNDALMASVSLMLAQDLSAKTPDGNEGT